MTYIHLDYTDLALAALLVVLNGGLSVALELGVERRLAVAALRMMVQLTLVGLVLTTLFALVSPLWTGLAALVMILFAGHEILSRQDRRLTGWWAYGLGTGAMLIAVAVYFASWFQPYLMVLFVTWALVVAAIVAEAGRVMLERRARRMG